MKLLLLSPKKLASLLLLYTLIVTAVTGLLTSNPERALAVLLISNFYLIFWLHKKSASPTAADAPKVLILDRSGSLASEVPELKALKSIDPRISELALMQRVASLLHKNEDLLSRTVVAAARAKSLELLEVEQFRAVPNLGVVGVVSQRRTFVGSAHFLRSEGIQPGALEALATSLIREGHQVALIGTDGKAIGIVAVSEPTRLESPETIQRARAIGLEVVLFSGESADAAKALADKMGITQVYGEVTPLKKVDLVRQIQSRAGGNVNFITGDLATQLEKLEISHRDTIVAQSRTRVFILYNIMAPLLVAIVPVPWVASLITSLTVSSAEAYAFRQRITS